MNIFNKLIKKANIIFGKSEIEFPVEATELDVQCLKFCSPFSMTSIPRLYATLSSIKYVLNNQIEGDIVECGVWRGGNAMVVAKTLCDFSVFEKKIYLFDTFDGMTPPTNMDFDMVGKSAQSQLNDIEKKKGDNIWCVAPIDDVRSNLASTGYPLSQIYFIKGDVLSTLENKTNLPDRISLLRLDTDWYESTKKELDVLFPLLVRGGVCLIDDYGHWQGARKAVDEYLANHKIYPLIHVTDYTGRIFIKI